METEIGAAKEGNADEVVDPESAPPGLLGRPRPWAAPQLRAAPRPQTAPRSCRAECAERADCDEVRRVGGIATNPIQEHKDI